MRTHEALDEQDFQRADALCRDGARLPDVVRDRGTKRSRPGRRRSIGDAVGLEPVLLQAMRPILTRAADAIMARTDLSDLEHRHICPLCGGEPDLAVITPAADRLLICGRCSARWRFHQITCPFCLNAERAQHHVIRQPRRPVPALRLRRLPALPQGVRRPQGSRPVMPAVDSVATLPLDAAAMQKGYR